MTARLSPQREASIVARAEAATPGPWKVEKDYCDCSEYGCSHPPFAVAFGPFTSFENTTDRHHYDADFAGHAREDVPALLAELAAVRAERDEARAELAKYVGHEPTIAEEMAYLSRCLHAVHDLCDGAEAESLRWENPLPVPEWVPVVREAATGERSENPSDRRRRLYIDGKGNGWVDLNQDSATGQRNVTGLTDQWQIKTTDEVIADTGSLREIGRCW